MIFEKKVSNRKKNVQVYPTRLLVIPNDRFAKVLFNLSNENFREDSWSIALKLIEVQRNNRFGKIVSPFRIFVDEQSEFTLSEPLDQFDCDVLIVCISEYRAENYYLTPAIIYRGLTGKIGRCDAEPSKDQLAAIMHSLKKLMSLQIDIIMTDICAKFNYEDGTSTHITANLLPCEIISETTINGKESTVIHLLDVSPIWKVACIKNHQTLSFDADLLDIPRQQNTPLNIMVKFYVIRRVLESIAHKQMALTVTFADVFKKCRLENAHLEIKRRIREFMMAIFEHLKNKGIIGDCKVNKKGRTFYSISFTKK